MPGTFNGIGTTYFGARHRQADGSFITTEWFVLLFLPIIPLRSLRVIPLGTESHPGGVTSSFTRRYATWPARLDFAQVAEIYAKLLLHLGGTYLAVDYVANHTRLLDTPFGGLVCVVVFIAGILVGPGFLYRSK